MPQKPIKRGIKCWVVADSTNGYISNLSVYTGKTEGEIESNLGMKVVLELTKDLPQGHHIYFDNFFSSIPLMESLLDRGQYSCGTFRVNRRGIPEKIKQVKLSK